MRSCSKRPEDAFTGGADILLRPNEVYNASCVRIDHPECALCEGAIMTGRKSRASGRM
ncbi:MAG TPA: hypothetical protein VL132_18390 [Planctomycetaceae bacterium]|nr:hypothetical protein [Planctomycetaceae bacterium]